MYLRGKTCAHLSNIAPSQDHRAHAIVSYCKCNIHGNRGDTCVPNLVRYSYMYIAARSAIAEELSMTLVSGSVPVCDCKFSEVFYCGDLCVSVRKVLDLILSLMIYR